MTMNLLNDRCNRRSGGPKMRKSELRQLIREEMRLVEAQFKYVNRNGTVNFNNVQKLFRKLDITNMKDDLESLILNAFYEGADWERANNSGQKKSFSYKGGFYK